MNKIGLKHTEYFMLALAKAENERVARSTSGHPIRTSYAHSMSTDGMAHEFAIMLRSDEEIRYSSNPDTQYLNDCRQHLRLAVSKALNIEPERCQALLRTEKGAGMLVLRVVKSALNLDLDREGGQEATHSKLTAIAECFATALHQGSTPS